MSRRIATHCSLIAAALLCAALPLTARAQQPDAGAATNEVPARLRHLEGTVTVQRAAAGETEEALVNLPLGSGDRIWSDDDGRVEIMFEDGTSLWLDARTTLDFVTLPRPDGSGGIIVRLWSGSVYVQRLSTRTAYLASLRLDAPSGSVLLDEGGLFRIDVDDDQTVWVSAYDGAAVLDAGGLSERVVAGQRTLAESGSAPARAVAFNTSESDDFSIWRDQRTAQYASTREYVRQREYLPRTVAHHAADLEPYGSWSYHPTYASWYWKPHAAVAWTPYRHGRWVYTYAGWAWVADEPWGWVTTHYGRWHHGSHGWIWFPGRTWAPASVHWYVGGGHIGWVPLNYYGRPAVSFGVHFGDGGVSVSYTRYYDYPYFGYAHPWWAHRRYSPRYKRCCGYGWDRWAYYDHGRGRQDFGRDRRDAFEVHPQGSASGTGRVVKGLGYSSGAADAWTVVPAADFSTADVGRRAVARTALPRDLGQGAKAELTGNLRARRPADLVPATPRRAVPTTSLANRDSVPATGTSGAVRATTGAGTGVVNKDSGYARQRGAVPRQADAGATDVTGAARRTATPRVGGRPVTTDADKPTASGPARRTAIPRAGASSTGARVDAPVRRTATPRTGAAPTSGTGDKPAVSTPARRSAVPTVRARPDTGSGASTTGPARRTSTPRGGGAVVPGNRSMPRVDTPARRTAVPRGGGSVGTGNGSPRVSAPARRTTSPQASGPARRTTSPRVGTAPSAGAGKAVTAPTRRSAVPSAGARPSTGGGSKPAVTPSSQRPSRTRARARSAPTRRTSTERSRTSTSVRRSTGTPAAAGSSSARRPTSSTATARRPSSSRPGTTFRSTNPASRAAPRVGTSASSRARGTTGQRPAVTRPSSGSRPSIGIRNTRRPAGSSATRGGTVRRAVPSGRTAPTVRPAPSRRPSSGGVRAPAPTRSGGGAARRPARAAKPRGGSAKPGSGSGSGS